MTKLAKYDLKFEKKFIENDNAILRTIKITIPAQNATITPPLGPILGQFGINIIDFCKKFNEKTKIFDNDVMLITLITLYKNKTFSFEIIEPTLCFLLYEAASLKENDILNKISLNILFKLLIFKRKQLFKKNKEINIKILKSIFGTLKSMHIEKIENE
jgi:large subunit ribosomal protein L11